MQLNPVTIVTNWEEEMEPKQMTRKRILLSGRNRFKALPSPDSGP